MPSEQQIEAALKEWMGQAAAFMFNQTFGVENSFEDWETRAARLRPWMTAALRAAEAGGEAISIPAAMNPNLLDILGRPNFACAHIANALRLAGATIAKKAEAEQAAVIHWMLGHYAKHGADWRQHAGDDLQEKANTLKVTVTEAAPSPPAGTEGGA